MSTRLSAQAPTMPRLVTGLALLGILVFVLPFLAAAAALVNINTADATQLETLPGIGASKAAAIIQYRELHGPFAAIASIQEVSGIGPATYANIEALITVAGAAAASAAPASDNPPAQDTNSSSSGSSADAVPASGTLAVQLGRARTVTLGTPVALSATVSLAGRADAGATVSWSFGDGSSANGRTVAKTYRYAGTYAVHASASDGSAQGEADIAVTVVPAQLRISAIGSEGITLANEASTSVDLSGWRLTSGASFFYLPSGMMLLADASVLLPQVVTGLPIMYDAKLYTADGQLAAAYEFPVAAESMQPSAPAAGSYPMQNVESPTPLGRGADQSVGSAISTNQTIHAAQAVSAPAAPTEVAAAGALLAPEPEEGTGEAKPRTSLQGRITKALKSPWALGALGLLVFSGGALIVL